MIVSQTLYSFFVSFLGFKWLDCQQLGSVLDPQLLNLASLELSYLKRVGIRLPPPGVLQACGIGFCPLCRDGGC